MPIAFFKFHGALNDFVVLDGRNNMLPAMHPALVRELCDRRAGIGADGVIVLSEDGGTLRMQYYNSDGFEGSMCGNGGRCFAAFARMLGLAQDHVTFHAYDGIHQATILKAEKNHYSVALEMGDVSGVEKTNGCYVLNTGSPHFIRFVDSLESLDVFSLGRSIRYAPEYAEQGINVNFVAPAENGISIRTYERGVEAETMACGTGSVAAAIAAFASGLVTDTLNIPVHTRGGTLNISFKKFDSQYKQVVLTGPAKLVYQGTYLNADV